MSSKQLSSLADHHDCVILLCFASFWYREFLPVFNVVLLCLPCHPGVAWGVHPAKMLSAFDMLCSYAGQEGVLSWRGQPTAGLVLGLFKVERRRV
jgi:hypothetical protein